MPSNKVMQLVTMPTISHRKVCFQNLYNADLLSPVQTICHQRERRDIVPDCMLQGPSQRTGCNTDVLPDIMWTKFYSDFSLSK